MGFGSLGKGSAYILAFMLVQGRCSLKDQIKHKAAFMREHMLLPGRPPAFILGHSIGEVTLLLFLSTRIYQSCRECRAWLG